MHRWTATLERLPAIGDKVLVISKFGSIFNQTYTNHGEIRLPCLFRPGGLKPNTDVKWWMHVPTDGWVHIRDAQPKEGEPALTMSKTGRVFSGVWGRSLFSPRLEFRPFVWEVVYWRPMPELPEGITLACHCK